MKRITGLSDLARGATHFDQEVMIRESEGTVCLYLAHPGWSAKMNPDEARFLGKLLTEAADRVGAAPHEPVMPPAPTLALKKGG